LEHSLSLVLDQQM
jgi:hypothetical protein